MNDYAPRFGRASWSLDDYLDAPPEARRRAVAAFRAGARAAFMDDLAAHLARVVAAEDAVRTERLPTLTIHP